MIRYIILLLLSSTLACSALPKGNPAQDPFRLDNLIPWSIVAFDSQERDPSERVAMIKELGLSRYAFGGRQKHIDVLPSEFAIAKENDIKIDAVWLYLNDKKDQVGKLRGQNEQVLAVVAESEIHPQIWIGFSPQYFEGLKDEEAYAKARMMLAYLAERAAQLDCTIGLYNHGGWMGDPDHQLNIIKDLDRENIGIVYNFHHGHEDLDRYQELFPRLLPHLLCVNLNGMEKDGKKILPIGSGDYERDMIKELEKLGYNGPWGILGHVKGGDAKEVLIENLKGLRNLDQALPTKQKRKRVFLLAGQSNMDGRANAAEISEEDRQRLATIEDRVLFHYNHQESQPLQPVSPKKHTQKKFDLEQSFGPELFFGINIAEANPQDSFVFIKRAQGGTSLHGCWNPYWTEEKAKLMDEENQPKLFSDFISYTSEILNGYVPTAYDIDGLLWVQGEDDSNKKRGPVPAAEYYRNLKNLIHETRKQLNMPKLPLYIFQVGNGKVVEGMKRLAAEDDQVFFIPQSANKKSKDYYEKNPPPIGHYTAKSMKRIGEAFYEMYKLSDNLKSSDN